MNIEQAAREISEKFFGARPCLYGISTWITNTKIYICISPNAKIRNLQKIPKIYKGFKVEIIKDWKRAN